MRFNCKFLRPLTRSFPAFMTVLLCVSGLECLTGTLAFSQVLGAFPNGGVQNSALYAGTAMVVNQQGDIIAAEPNGNDVVSFNPTSKSFTTLGSFNNAGTVALDAQNNLYISTLYDEGANIVKVPYVSGAYVAVTTPTGSTPACAGSDTAECYVPNLTDSADGYYIQVRSMTFDAAGDLFVGTGEGEIIECTAYCLTTSPTLLYKEPASTSSNGDSYVTGAMAVDANGNLFFTDSDFYANSSTMYVEYSYMSNLKELVYTSGKGFAATPIVLDSLTPASVGSGPESDEITGLAIVKNGVYFTTIYDGIFGFLNTAGVVTPATPYTLSTQPGRVLATNGTGQFYVDSLNSTTNVDDLIQVDIAGISSPAATPTFTPASGTYESAVTATVSSTTPGATIYYTTDGVTTPTTSSTSVASGGTITVGTTETVMAIAAATGYSSSPVGSVSYIVKLPPPAAATPTISPAAGQYLLAQTVTLTSATAGATIYYTTDGVTIPNIASTTIASGGTITVSASETVMARTFAPGYGFSPVVTAVYTIGVPPQNFLVAVNPSALTVDYGSTGTVTVSVNPIDVLTSPVSFACSGLPSGTTCSFSSATVTTTGTTASTTTLTVTPPAATASATAALQRGEFPFLPGGTVAAAALCMLGLRKRRGLRLALVLMLSVAATGLVIGCSSGGSKSTTSSTASTAQTTTTSTVIVTATSGTTKSGATFALTVQATN